MIDLNFSLGAPSGEFTPTPAEEKKPFFVSSSPVDMTVEESAEEVIFTAYLDPNYGGAATSAKWYINDEEQENEGAIKDDGYTLEITSNIAIENDRDRYYVEASNEHGDVTSKTATLIYYIPPDQYNDQYNHQYA